ncbi:MAG TPA: sigma 54-interacting transcriptional regulator, partial [Candidatus Acidoferrales bacterium]|nr:sigma 54-interacting transcriptional regulator [Candidatus Acidoferrales bacterium]
VVFVTGGADSPFGFLYSLIVINGAILLSTSGALVVASTGSICYAGLVGLLASEIIPRPDYPFTPSPPDLQFAMRFATTNATFFLIAVLASSLTRRIHVAEQLLQQREAERDRLASLHEALARNIGSALITTDADGRVTSANHVAEDLAEARAADLVGKDLGIIFPPLRSTVTGRLSQLQSLSHDPTEFARRTGNGDEKMLRCSAAVLRDTYQNPIGALFILQDITPLRQLETRMGSNDDEVVAEDFELDDTPPADGLIGNSPALARVREFIDKVSRSDATVLISGESGTGKELVARAVHARGNRCERPFIPINCGAIPENLIETELFGHAKGAFTGAVAARAGLFRAADGGTIFLDEIGELPLALQVKLLRVLQERTFTPVGSDTSVSVDVRVIAATNRSLDEEVCAGRFREDLFYRLNVLTLALPPLRERRQDIPLLVRRFLRQFSDLHGKAVQRLSVAAARRLQEYAYPGNIRELENIIEHAVALCDGESVHEQHLPEYTMRGTREATGNGESMAARGAGPEVTSVPLPTESVPPGNLDDNLAAYEKTIILRALAEAGGVKKRAADLLGINYRSFRHRLQKYGLSDSSDRFPYERDPAARLS